MNRNQAEKDRFLDVVLKRKRKFFDDEYYDDRRWNHARDFDQRWLRSLDEKQPELVTTFRNAKSWIEYLPTGKFRCKTCHQNVKKFREAWQFTPDLANDLGVWHNSYQENIRVIEDHKKNPTHMKIEERLKNDQEKAGLFSDYMYIKESDTLITSEVMRTVYVAVKHMGTSFNSIEHMIDVQEIHGVDLGSQCKSRRTFTNMVASISTTMHNRLLDHIRTSPYPISIIVDGSTDVSNNHLLAILIQTLEDDMPMNYYYALIKLETDESAESQTEALIDKLTKDNIYDAVQNKIISFVSDGASVMTGKNREWPQD